MEKIKVVGRYRSFFIDLFDKNINNFKFEYSLDNKFEVPKKSKKILLKLFNLKMLDFLGLFTSYSSPIEKYKYLFSYNRFIKKPNTEYVIYIENPTALVNYSTTKMNSFLGKRKSSRHLNNVLLTNLICMSKICKESFSSYYGNEYNNKITQIYPLINDIKESQTEFALSVDEENIRILFVGATFIGKGGLELVEVIKALISEKISFTIVTKINEIPVETLEYLSNCEKVELNDFVLSKEELNSKYQQADIFVLPTKFESFGLVFLEALKNGCSLIGPKMYAIPEMIHDEVNGYLYNPSLNAWSDEGRLLEENYDSIIKESKEKNYDSNLVEFLTEKIKILSKNTEKLSEQKKNSLKISQNEEFGEYYILKKWRELLR